MLVASPDGAVRVTSLRPRRSASLSAVNGVTIFSASRQDTTIA
jgi:hypothetical protein